MEELIRGLLGSGMLPGSFRYAGNDGLLALQVASDVLIALAYYSIPLTLLVFALKRPHTGHNWVLLLFAGFITACGTTHLMGVYTQWVPAYWLDGAMKAMTAGISLATAIALWPLLPRVLALPTPTELKRTNERLQAEVEERRRAEAELRSYRDQLEERVAERARELEQSQNERLQLERRVAASRRLESLGAMAGGVAHDFNNLLMGVLGHADLALRDEQSQATRESLEQIRLAGRRATELTARMLAFTGQKRLKLEPTDLVRLAAELCEEQREWLPQDVVLETALEPTQPVGVDRYHLKEALQHVLSNAAEALEGREGRLIVRTGQEQVSEQERRNAPPGERPLPDGTYAFIEVDDDGPGMSEHVSERIFEPFFSTRFTGRGLGLPAAQGIVHAHGGAMRVQSSPEAGTRVRIVLPVVQEPSARVAGPLPAEPGGTARTQVLVVDDEAQVRQVAEAMLARCGYEAVHATDGLEALARCEQARGALAAALVDATMPRMSGADTCRALHQLLPDLPLILCSGYTAEDIEALHQLGGVVAFLQKPFSGEQLQETLAFATGYDTGGTPTGPGARGRAPGTT